MMALVKSNTTERLSENYRLQRQFDQKHETLNYVNTLLYTMATFHSNCYVLYATTKRNQSTYRVKTLTVHQISSILLLQGLLLRQVSGVL